MTCCQAEGCDSTEVEARAVAIDGTWRTAARVLLCDQHGAARPLWTVWQASLPRPMPRPTFHPYGVEHR